MTRASRGSIGGQNRKVAQFGFFRYNYDTSHVEEVTEDSHPIPMILRRLLLESCATKVLEKLADPTTTAFTQCIINVYQADDIIPWHWDHVDFGPTVLVFTFGEARPLPMRRRLQPLLYPRSQCHDGEDEDFEYYTANPRHGSCYILSGPSRYQWEHSVPPGNRFRLSITFRTLNGKNHITNNVPVLLGRLLHLQKDRDARQREAREESPRNYFSRMLGGKESVSVRWIK
jgi:alkylated DNA repair dioxygenase AlkB